MHVRWPHWLVCTAFPPVHAVHACFWQVVAGSYRVPPLGHSREYGTMLRMLAGQYLAVAGRAHLAPQH
jgi:hypothetical protein